MATFLVIVNKEAAQAPKVSFDVISVALIFAAAAGVIGALLGGIIRLSCPTGFFDWGKIDWRNPEESKHHLWRVRQQQVAIKFFIFWLLCVIFKNFLVVFFQELIPLGNSENPQRIFFISPVRPMQSCATSCSMPSGSALLSYGTLTFILIETTFSLMLPHMWQSRTYTGSESTRLGFRPITTADFLRNTLAALLTFGPVPLARVLLQDNSPEQVTFGCMFGALLAVVYHMFYVKMLRGDIDGGSRVSNFRWVLARWPTYLCRCCSRGPQDTAGGSTSERHAPLLDGTELRSVEEGSAVVLAQDATESSRDPFEAFSAMAEVPIAKENDGAACLSGFEFMGVCTNKELESLQQAAQGEKIKRETSGKLFEHVSLVTQGINQAVEMCNPTKLDDILVRHAEEFEKLKESAERLQVMSDFTTCVGLLERPIKNAKKKKDEWDKAVQDLEKKIESFEQAKTVDHRESLSAPAFTAFIHCIDLGLDLNQAVQWKPLVQRLETQLQTWQKGAASLYYKKELTSQVLSIIFSAKPEDFGDFSYPHLKLCLEVINKFQPPQATAESKYDAQKKFNGIVEKALKSKKPRELKGLLENLKSLISFLHYIRFESVKFTQKEFQADNKEMETANPELWKIIREVTEKYAEGADETATSSNQTFLRQSDADLVLEKPKEVIQKSMKRKELADGLIGSHLQKIFATLAEQKEKSTGLVMVPHHTQVVALLIMRKVFEKLTEKTLMAQMSTGEGKSMVVAALICYLLMEDKTARVHVIGGRNELVERDYWEFKELFDEILGKESTCLLLDDKSMDDNVWSKRLVYTTKTQLFRLYSREAQKTVTAGSNLFSNYESCYLVVDEVDALVVDGEPNSNLLVPDKDHSEHAEKCLKAFFNKEDSNLSALKNKDPELTRHVTHLAKLAKDSSKLLEGKYEKRSDKNGVDFWVALDRNRDPDFTKRDNQLAVLNYLEQLGRGDQQTPCKWLENSLVISSPHVFRKYKRILGLSGSLGNENEQQFVKEAYGAMFLKIPEFLRTCKDMEFHEAKWVHEVERTRAEKWQKLITEPTDDEREHERDRSMVVVDNEERQLNLAWNVAKTAHKHVPVLVIAKDAAQGRKAVNKFKDFCREERNEQLNSDLLIGDMTRKQLEESKKKYDYNLTSSTQSFGPNDAPMWRITVTDNTGARGTNYAMSEEGQSADDMGGLLLVLLYIPDNERDWIQYKGRTARQKWKGQMCAILCSEDYRKLPTVIEHQYPQAPAKIVETILAHGEVKTGKALEDNKSAMVFGLYMNRWGEQVLQLGKQRLGDKFKDWRQLLSTYLYMEIDSIKQKTAAIITPTTPDQPIIPKLWPPPVPRQRPGKALLFALDCSGSMRESIPGSEPKTTLLDVCKERVVKLFERFVKGGEDHWGLTSFASDVQRKVRMQQKTAQDDIKGNVSALSASGYTQLHGAICNSVQDLKAYAGCTVDWSQNWSTDLQAQMKELQSENYSVLTQNGETIDPNRKDYTLGESDFPLRVIPKIHHETFLVVLTDGQNSYRSPSEADVDRALSSFCGTVIFMTLGAGVTAVTTANMQAWAQLPKKKGFLVNADDANEANVAKAFEEVAAHMEDVAGILDN
eukprot:TRINITY_DN10543_c0_g1_i1.p1 TRINITY_DN10543_c0_g1~~TRINITY_DN10543_c0_g1_i1.p1  ORF type:complete len:1734 (-),score=304.39 TRINITY_DN10543_c0_g1_i1:237-5042(-)